MPSLDRISIRGFKSIASLEDFELRKVNILVGANGSGKSNFLEFFAFLRAMCGFSLPFLPVGGLANYCAVHGGCETILHNGIKTTSSLKASLDSEGTTFSLELLPTADNSLVFARHNDASASEGSRAVGKEELENRKSPLHKAVASWQLFHLNATEMAAPLRKSSNVFDDAYLRPDASNLAAFLLHLRKTAPKSYMNIVWTTRLVIPSFDHFVFREQPGDRVRLFWKAARSGNLLGTHQLSDGSLRYIALATAFLQPNPPSLMLVDEPEIGQSPVAMGLLADMIHALPSTTRVVLATQSQRLIHSFEPEDLVRVRFENGASVFERMQIRDYPEWVRDCPMGDLRRRNVICNV